MIEYKKYFEARESVSLERKCIPALYMNMESGYADGLKVERKKIREKYTRNTKFKGWFFVLAVLAAAIVTFGILALIIRVTTGSFGYIWIAAIACEVLAILTFAGKIFASADPESNARRTPQAFRKSTNSPFEKSVSRSIFGIVTITFS